jgi:Mrp family chromosome partitioning ATPase
MMPRESLLASREADQLQSAMDELLQQHRLTVRHNCETVAEQYSTLNTDQERIVDRVVSSIMQKVTVKLVVSGPGGIGKSRVIEAW